MTTVVDKAEEVVGCLYTATSENDDEDGGVGNITVLLIVKTDLDLSELMGGYEMDQEACKRDPMEKASSASAHTLSLSPHTMAILKPV